MAQDLVGAGRAAPPARPAARIRLPRSLISVARHDVDRHRHPSACRCWCSSSSRRTSRSPQTPFSTSSSAAQLASRRRAPGDHHHVVVARLRRRPFRSSGRSRDHAGRRLVGSADDPRPTRRISLPTQFVTTLSTVRMPEFGRARRSGPAAKHSAARDSFFGRTGVVFSVSVSSLTGRFQSWVEADQIAQARRARRPSARIGAISARRRPKPAQQASASRPLNDCAALPSWRAARAHLKKRRSSTAGRRSVSRRWCRRVLGPAA